jgi:ABC-type branched-subunit amino acid transport system ATPase component
MLEIKNITKSFGELKVLNNLIMHFNRGNIYSIVGGNGAGKTTLFNLISGFLQPDIGEIWFNKKRIDNLSPIAINSNGITRTFQDLRIINQLTVRENILLSFKNNPGENIFNTILPCNTFRSKYSMITKRTNQILEIVHLKEVENSLASEVSYGQQKLLTIGCCLANDAQLLLLDEPVAGIDIENYTLIYNLILDLKNEGRTILQIEHNHGFIENLSDGIWFLSNGKAIYFDSYNSFITDQLVKETYLN